MLLWFSTEEVSDNSDRNTRATAFDFYEDFLKNLLAHRLIERYLKSRDSRVQFQAVLDKFYVDNN